MWQQELFAPPPLTLPPEHEVDTVIVSFSGGIDSTGALFTALETYGKNRLIMLYLDSGIEWPDTGHICERVAKHLGIRYVELSNQQKFMDILRARKMWPSSVNRWCTAYLKTGPTEKWIRANRRYLGRKVVFITGERWDESSRRSRLPEVKMHRTTLKTSRKGEFECYWWHPVLQYPKQTMFEMGEALGIPPHYCYEWNERCSCVACIFAPLDAVRDGIRRYPELFREMVRFEKEYGHTWRKDVGIMDLWREVYQETGCKELLLA